MIRISCRSLLYESVSGVSPAVDTSQSSSDDLRTILTMMITTILLTLLSSVSAYLMCHVCGCPETNANHDVLENCSGNCRGKSYDTIMVILPEKVLPQD